MVLLQMLCVSLEQLFRPRRMLRLSAVQIVQFTKLAITVPVTALG